MKILLIARGFNKRDGISRYVAELAERFVRDYSWNRKQEGVSAVTGTNIFGIISNESQVCNIRHI